MQTLLQNLFLSDNSTTDPLIPIISSLKKSLNKDINTILHKKSHKSKHSKNNEIAYLLKESFTDESHAEIHNLPYCWKLLLENLFRLSEASNMAFITFQ